MKTLIIKNVCKNFGGFEALKNIFIELEEDSRLAIIGPNGAGKTTLMHIISGVIRPSSGRIFLFENDITKLPPYVRCRMGLSRTFQILSLFPNLTVIENLRLSLVPVKSNQFSLLRPIDTFKDLVDMSQTAVKKIGLWEKKDMIVSNLSHGEQKQVEIAMSLAQNPALLLLDEPTAGLSQGEAALVSSMIRSLSRNVAVIIVEHNVDVALQLAKHVLVLNQGMVMAEGSPEEIKRNPEVQEVYLGKEDIVNY